MYSKFKQIKDDLDNLFTKKPEEIVNIKSWKKTLDNALNNGIDNL